MNQRTAKLIKKYSGSKQLDYREVKKLWVQMNAEERTRYRNVMKAELQLDADND